MNIVAFIFVIIAGALAGYELILTRLRSLLAWAVLLTELALLIQFCSTWSRTVHF